MSLIQTNRKALDRVKQLAKAGDWQAAKDLIDTLPSTPDTERLRKRIAKQLYVSTGEIPAADDVQVVDSKTTAEMASGEHKVKRVTNKKSVDIPSAILNAISALILLAASIALIYAWGVPNSYRLYSASAVQITQVYSEATFGLLRAISLFALVAVLQLAVIARR